MQTDPWEPRMLRVTELEVAYGAAPALWLRRASAEQSATGITDVTSTRGSAVVGCAC